MKKNYVETNEDIEEFDEDELDDLLDEIDDEEDTREYEFTCKPCFNFQSIEFKFKGKRAEIPDMMSIYKEILEELVEIAVEQPGQERPGRPNRENAPTEAQIKILKDYGIKYDPKTITKKEASELITKSMESSR